MYFREGEERESGARLTGAAESDVATDAAPPTEARPVVSQTINVTSAYTTLICLFTRLCGTDGVAAEARKVRWRACTRTSAPTLTTAASCQQEGRAWWIRGEKMPRPARRVAGQAEAGEPGGHESDVSETESMPPPDAAETTRPCRRTERPSHGSTLRTLAGCAAPRESGRHPSRWRRRSGGCCARRGPRSGVRRRGLALLDVRPPWTRDIPRSAGARSVRCADRGARHRRQSPTARESPSSCD